MDSLDRHFFKFQSQLLTIDLQLAEIEEKPKRSGDFESTYKTESGKEVVVKRSPDGKFANKNGGATTTATKPDNTPPLDPQVARENGRAVREILTGKIGDDIKKDLAADFEHRPIIKEAIEKVDFAEVTKGDADALTNVSKFMSEKFEQALNASSMLARETLGAAVGIAGFVARSLMYSAAFGATLILGSAGIGVFKKGMRPDKALIQQTSTIAPAVLKSMFSKKSLIRRMQVGAIFEGVFRAIELASEELGKKSPPIVEPEADKAVREAMRAIGNNTLQNSLIAGAVQSPGVTEGIKSTNIEDVIEGSQDAFSNAVAFMRDKVEEAATVVSENKKEIAIGAAVVALAVASAGATAILNTVAIRAGVTTVLGLLKGSSFSDALILGLKSATPEKIKELASRKKYALAISLKLGITAHQAIKEQVESVKLARSGGIGAKSFGQKEEAVKKLVAEEGLDYEKVLQAIARRKEEVPNPKKAEQAQKQILELEREIQDGVAKVAEITKGRLGLNRIEMKQVLSITKRETEIRSKIIEKRGELEQAEGRGFSISRRLSELSDIATKEGKDSLSYKWRINVVKAELEYGDDLDNLDSFGGYNKLLSAMKKPKPAPGTYKTASVSDNSAITELFESGGSPTKTPRYLRSKTVDAASSAGLELQNYLATPINAQVGLFGGMTCAFFGGNNKYSQMMKDVSKTDSRAKVFTETDMFKDKNIDGLINIGDVAIDAIGYTGGQKLQGYNLLASTKEHTREVMWHESGHLLEVKLGKVEESAAFREERAQEVPVNRKIIPSQGLSAGGLSAGSQDYALGAFYSPYIGLRVKGQGKHANTDRATEVLSSGMELLSSPTLAKRGVKADRETMLYALAAMNEKVKD